MLGMKLSDYLSQERGRLVWLAREIGAHTSDLSAWAAGKKSIPTRYGWPIEKATGGNVTRGELFSLDVVSAHWPELSPASGKDVAHA